MSNLLSLLGAAIILLVFASLWYFLFCRPLLKMLKNASKVNVEFDAVPIEVEKWVKTRS